ncbi:MAG: hypothetical protein ACXWL8_05500, partial [Candidatus Limnocylindria bacterium]
MILHTPAPRSRFAFRGLPALGPDRVAVALAKRLDDSYHYVRHAAAAGLEPVEVVVVGDQFREHVRAHVLEPAKVVAAHLTE